MIFEPNIQISEEAIFSKDHKNPVFLVLSSGSSWFANAIKAVTKNEFSHAMISFNSKLDPLYSFGTRTDGKLGFVINNPKDRVWDIEDCKYSVYVMYVTDKAKRAMKKRLDDFVSKEKDLKYSFKGILDIWRGKESEKDEKWFCSRFVMEIISKAQNLAKVPSLWRPGDIEQLSNISLVNRGFNFYNYDYKVTDRHVKDIEKGTYNPGDVIYEGTDRVAKYSVEGDDSWLEQTYVGLYREYYYKIPQVGFPGSDEEYEDMCSAAKKAASKYYTFKVSDANRNYPFKFYNVLNIDKNKYMSLINGNVPGIKRLDANLYHVNISDKNKRISIILVARPGEIFAMYLLITEDALLRFNYKGIMYQESTINEYSRDEFVDYLTTGDEYYLRNHYKERYSYYNYKIPQVRFPENVDSYEEVKNAAIAAARKYYKFRVQDSNRHYPFKFYSVLDISKDRYIKMLKDKVPGTKSWKANFYHINIYDSPRRISVILIATQDEIYEMYLLLDNDTLLKFNNKGTTFNKEYILNSAIMELSSSVEKDYQSSKDMNISQFPKMRLTDAIIQVYGQSYPSMRHIRINNRTKGYVWLKDKQIVGYINVEEKDDDSKWIQAFEIFPPYKGHGLSKQMLNIAVNEFGANYLSVSKNNDLAIKVYKSYGFKIYKSTDTMYFMTKDGSIEESYYVKDPLTGRLVRSAYTDNDYKITAQLAQQKIRALQNEGRLKFLKCIDIEWNDNSLAYAEYNIEKNIDIVELTRLIKVMNEIVKTSQYCGTFELPEQLSKGSIGKTRLLLDEKIVDESNKEEVEEKGLKSYKNPSMQLRIKNSKKKNDQIKKGNYTDIAPSLPEPSKTDKS